MKKIAIKKIQKVFSNTQKKLCVFFFDLKKYQGASHQIRTGRYTPRGVGTLYFYWGG